MSLETSELETPLAEEYALNSEKSLPHYGQLCAGIQHYTITATLSALSPSTDFSSKHDRAISQAGKEPRRCSFSTGGPDIRKGSQDRLVGRDDVHTSIVPVVASTVCQDIVARTRRILSTSEPPESVAVAGEFLRRWARGRGVQLLEPFERQLEGVCRVPFRGVEMHREEFVPVLDRHVEQAGGVDAGG